MSRRRLVFRGQLPTPTERREQVREEREALLKKSPEQRREILRKANFSIGVVFCSIFGFFLALGCSDRNTMPNWETFTYKDSGFSVEMPNEPILSSKSVQTQKGRVPLIQYQHKSIAFIYYVSVAEFPRALINSQPKEQTLIIMMEDQILGMSGSLIKSNRSSFQGYPAIYFSARLPKDGAELRNDNTLSCMIVIKGNRIYRVSAIGLGNAEERNRFISSFKLL